MNRKERKQRREELERQGFSFKYLRGNVEVGGGYAVIHKGKEIGGGREYTLDEAIELAEQQTPRFLEIRKYLMGHSSTRRERRELRRRPITAKGAYKAT